MAATTHVMDTSKYGHSMFIKYCWEISSGLSGGRGLPWSGQRWYDHVVTRNHAVPTWCRLIVFRCHQYSRVPYCIKSSLGNREIVWIGSPPTCSTSFNAVARASNNFEKFGKTILLGFGGRRRWLLGQNGIIWSKLHRGSANIGNWVVLMFPSELKLS